MGRQVSRRFPECGLWNTGRHGGGSFVSGDGDNGDPVFGDAVYIRRPGGKSIQRLNNSEEGLAIPENTLRRVWRKINEAFVIKVRHNIDILGVLGIIKLGLLLAGLTLVRANTT